MAEHPNYYSILGVPPRATEDEIKVAFSRQVKRFPEEARDPSANAAFRQLVMAFKVLSDPASRAAFDQVAETQFSSGARALRVQLLANQTTLPVLEEDQVLYLLLDISADSNLSGQAAPMNLCLVIDRSTSMAGARMSQVKAASSLIVDQLGEKDSLSIVAFSDRAEVIVPSRPVDSKPMIKAKISQISTGGATEIYQGLKLGITELSKGMRLSEISHLILLTDGHTYGDEESSIRLAVQCAARGIGISALGIGHKWNDVFLDALVSPSGSASAFLESPKLIVSYLEQRIKALNRAFAQDVNLRLELSSQVSVRAIHKLSPFPHPIPFSERLMALGTLQHSVPLSALIELQVKPHAPRTSTMIKANVSANIIPTGERDQHFLAEIQLDFSVDPPQKPPLPAVVSAVNKLNLYMMNEKAWNDVEQGEIQQATRRMERLGTQLLQSGEPHLAHTAFSEAANIGRTGRVSEAGRKRLKYGTRALIRYDNLP